MKPFHTMGAYAAAVTVALAAVLSTGAARPVVTRIDTLDVRRINVREPDGTLRMVIAGKGRIGGLVVAGKEYPHPGRTQAGMIFFNDEGTENGGLVFDGGRVDGKPTNSGHLSFDRWRQDQTLFLQSREDGARRSAGLYVQDRPDTPLQFDHLERLRAMPDGPAKDAAYIAAGFDETRRRAFLGRDTDGASKLALRDGRGRVRLELRVTEAGDASVRFLDETGRLVRETTAAS